MKNNLLPLLLLFLLACCCKDKDPEPELPPITTIGANTFGCKVNGKVWLPNKRPNGTLPQIEGGIVTRYDSIGPEKNWYDLLIFAYKEDNSGFQLFLRRINNTGSFQLYMTQSIWPGCEDCTNSYGYFYREGKRYSTLTLPENKVELLRYDTINKIFSGTFSFLAKNRQGDDTVRITEGRFDINQKQIN